VVYISKLHLKNHLPVSLFSSRGMYLCRTLSYKGAEFEVIEALLDERMMVISKSPFFFIYNLDLFFHIA
jgi:hypothetical protein